MRTFLIVLLIAAVVFTFAGCGAKKSEQAEKKTKVTTKSSDTEEPAKSEPSAPEPKKAVTKTRDGWIVTESGLKYKDKKVGKGTEAKAGDFVTVHYKGWLDDGTVFDTSKQPGREPFTFTLGAGEVIPGWDEGVAGMKPGGIRELVIPPALGYGSRKVDIIPANSTLHFEVELLK